MVLRRQNGKAAIVGIALFLWLYTFLLAGSPVLHALAHADSKSPKHECVVTLLTKGQLLCSGSPLVITREADVFCILPMGSATVRLPDVAYRLSPSRAPPVAVSSQALIG